jgi:hypothetical protein
MRTLPPLRALLLTMLFTVVPPCVAQEARIVLPAGVINQAYSQNLSGILKEKYHLTLRTSSDTPAYEWRLPGPGSAGLGIDPATGTILGTPNIAKRYLFRVEVLDRSLPQPAPLKLLISLQITSGEAPVNGSTRKSDGPSFRFGTTQ